MCKTNVVVHTRSHWCKATWQRRNRSKTKTKFLWPKLPCSLGLYSKLSACWSTQEQNHSATVNPSTGRCWMLSRTAVPQSFCVTMWWSFNPHMDRGELETFRITEINWEWQWRPAGSRGHTTTERVMLPFSAQFECTLLYRSLIHQYILPSWCRYVMQHYAIDTPTSRHSCRAELSRFLSQNNANGGICCFIWLWLSSPIEKKHKKVQMFCNPSLTLTNCVC